MNESTDKVVPWNNPDIFHGKKYATGKHAMKTREDYDRFLAEARKTTGIDALTPNETGLVSLRVQDEYNVNLQFIEATVAPQIVEDILSAGAIVAQRPHHIGQRKCKDHGHHKGHALCHGRPLHYH